MNDDDLVNYQRFLKVISQGDFNLKGEAVVTAAHLFQWFNSLGPKIKNVVDKQKAEKEIALKNVQDSIKPIKKKKGKNVV